MVVGNAGTGKRLRARLNAITVGKRGWKVLRFRVSFGSLPSEKRGYDDSVCLRRQVRNDGVRLGSAVRAHRSHTAAVKDQNRIDGNTGALVWSFASVRP